MAAAAVILELDYPNVPASKRSHENIGEFRSTVMAGRDPAMTVNWQCPRWFSWMAASERGHDDDPRAL
jgi:hypothetical protein